MVHVGVTATNTAAKSMMPPAPMATEPPAIAPTLCRSVGRIGA